MPSQPKSGVIDQHFQKAAKHGAKVQIKSVERIFDDAAVVNPATGQMRDMEHFFETAGGRRAELQSQLLVQKEMNAKHAEILAQTLAAAAMERVQLREKVDKLSKNIDMLAAQTLREKRDRVQRPGVKGRGAQSRLASRPTVEDAEGQPTHVSELSHQILAELAMHGNHCAQRERLLREIMTVDSVSWEEAHDVLAKFDEYNERYYWLESLPYRVGITFAFVGGVLGFSLVFWKPAAEWYGASIAGEELPENVKDIDELTYNQVGTWTWSWMEPMIGVASFALLCAQFSRAQLQRMNMKTYGEHLLQWRANRLAKRFPEYNRSMVRAWAKHMPAVNMNFFPAYEKSAGTKGLTSGL